MSEPGFASLGPSLLARKGGAKPAMRPQVAPLVADEAAIAALAEEQLEDLGWNDMGDSDADGSHLSSAEIVPINADVAADDFVAGAGPIVRRQQRRLEERVLADAVMNGPDDTETDDEDAGQPVYGEAFGNNDQWDDEDEQYETDEGAQFAALASGLSSSVVPASSVMPEPVRAAPAARAQKLARIPAPLGGRRAAFTLRLDADRHLKLRLAATMQGISAQALVTEALDRLLAEYDDLDIIANHLKRH
ncbi:hypothetical protein [Erythrobacter sp. R86502]|uniref:hypothetical protein n=1 Tax=Erythrobacter sp. R86502 TaxID=3093846 RepID=UPI0036D3DD83